MRRLRAGDIFSYIEGDPGEFQVLRVTHCSAICRPLAKQHRVIYNLDGSVKAEFDSYGRTFQISPQSFVNIWEDGPLTGHEARTWERVQT